MEPPISDVVWVDLAIADRLKPRCLAILSAEEVLRAGNFVRAADRDRFVVSHAAWRIIVGRHLNADPRALTFAPDQNGKPQLTGRWQGQLHLNLSHSGERAMVGLSSAGRIGVDIEAVRPMTDALRIARHHFAAEEVAELGRRDPPSLLGAFMGLWVRKEAFVKACGLGLSLRLDSFVMSVPPAPARLLSIGGDPAAARAWSIHHLEPATGYVGAVAIEAPAAEIDVRSLPPDWAEAPI